jgi:hypothetical protein
MTKGQEGKKSKLNNQVPDINRGFELMLRSHHKEENSLRPKTFQIMFGKMVSLFKREFHIYFEFNFDIKKSNSRGEKKC